MIIDPVIKRFDEAMRGRGPGWDEVAPLQHGLTLPRIEAEWLLWRWIGLAHHAPQHLR